MTTALGFLFAFAFVAWLVIVIAMAKWTDHRIKRVRAQIDALEHAGNVYYEFWERDPGNVTPLKPEFEFDKPKQDEPPKRDHGPIVGLG